MNRVPVLGIPIDNLTKEQLLKKFDELIAESHPRQITTVNAEFLVETQRDAEFRAVLQQSSLNTADGIGVLWAAKYLSLPLLNVWVIRIWILLFELVWTGLSIIFYPKYIRSVIPQKISGSEVIWWIVEHAEQKGYSIYLLGGFNDTAELAAKKLKEKYQSLKIAGTYAGSPSEEGIVERINKVKPDILLVAYGQIAQEKWISQNLQNLEISTAIGLGGTFDYIAGIKPFAPQILRAMGLEWLHRLITQPRRWKRVLNAVVTFPWYIMRHRLQILKPYRKNVAACILNDKNEILLCRRKIVTREDFYTLGKEHWQLPQGGVDAGEEETEALVREVREETGLKHIEVIGELLNTYSYQWPITMTDGWSKIYCGQVQSLYFIKFHSDHDKITLDNDEFDEYKWVSKSELINEIHPVRRKLAEIIVKNIDKFVT
jgi:N-acetylglucosaminyldiphosphoundecaprenol N-acetyl-beta-D-mannosaminyltransferase